MSDQREQAAACSTPLTSSFAWDEENPFRRRNALARSPNQPAEAVEERARSSPPTLQRPQEEQADPKERAMAHLASLGQKARELRKLMVLPKRSITNPMRDLVDEIEYLQRELESCWQAISAEQAVAKVAQPAVTERAGKRARPEPRNTTHPSPSPSPSPRPKKPKHGPKKSKKTEKKPQEGQMRDAVARKGPEDAPKEREVGWVKVVARQRPKPKQQQRPRPPRSDAIVIAATSTVSYADILRKVKLGQSVQGVRRTAKGELLLMLEKSADPRTQEMQAAVKEALGSTVEVRSLTETVILEVRDIDEVSTQEEVLAELKAQAGVVVYFYANPSAHWLHIDLA
ncbi:GL19688 [Drosophila persimilis]|uniref:GL19688 n=1 Tax=Drosophila persimilis TaxID=7234 RepID=B4HCF5_DROPE|nr:GL19688 [Drosophila persimilis]